MYYQSSPSGVIITPLGVITLLGVLPVVVAAVVPPVISGARPGLIIPPILQFRFPSILPKCLLHLIRWLSLFLFLSSYFLLGYSYHYNYDGFC